jgi:hypothetical protein
LVSATRQRNFSAPITFDNTSNTATPGRVGSGPTCWKVCACARKPPRIWPEYRQLGVTRAQDEDPAASQNDPWVVPRSAKPRTRHERRFFSSGPGSQDPSMRHGCRDIEGYNSYLRPAGGPEVQGSMLTSSRIVWRPVNPALSCWSFLSGVPNAAYH